MKTKTDFGKIVGTILHLALHVGCAYYVLNMTTIVEQNLIPYACMFGLVTSYLSDIYIQLKKLNNKD